MIIIIEARVTFYAGVKKGNNDSSITDFIKTIAIPPLKFDITTSPKTLALRPGDNKTIELIVNSSENLHIINPVAYFSIYNLHKDIIKTAIIKNKVLSTGTANMGLSTGIDTTPLTIFVTKDALPHQYLFFIRTNSTFVNYSPLLGGPYLPPLGQSTLSYYPVTITVQEPLTWAQRIGFVSSDNSQVRIPQEYLIGIYTLAATIFTGWLVPNIAHWITAKRQAIHVSRYMTTIMSTYDSLYPNKEKCENSLEKIRRHIAETFAKGKINETNYKILNETISEYKSQLDKAQKKQILFKMQYLKPIGSSAI